MRAGVADEPDTCVVAADSRGRGKDRRSGELVPKLAGYRHRSGGDATGLDSSPKVDLLQVRVVDIRPGCRCAGHRKVGPVTGDPHQIAFMLGADVGVAGEEPEVRSAGHRQDDHHRLRRRVALSQIHEVVATYESAARGTLTLDGRADRAHELSRAERAEHDDKGDEHGDRRAESTRSRGCARACPVGRRRQRDLVEVTAEAVAELR